jgi:hypothetical protein
MTPAPTPPIATSQPGRAAGIGAVALAALVGVVVAALFLALIGADRSDQAARLITTAPRASYDHATRRSISCRAVVRSIRSDEERNADRT